MGEEMVKCAACGKTILKCRADRDDDWKWYCWSCAEKYVLPQREAKYRRMKEEEERRWREAPPEDAFEYIVQLPPLPPEPEKPKYHYETYFKGELKSEIFERGLGGWTKRFHRIKLRPEDFGKTFSFVTTHYLPGPMYVSAHWVVVELRPYDVDVGLYERYGDEEMRSNYDIVTTLHGYEKTVSCEMYAVKAKWHYKTGELSYMERVKKLG
jgi:hypothetical protein